MNTHHRTGGATSTVLAILCLLTACASGPADSSGQPASPESGFARAEVQDTAEPTPDGTLPPENDAAHAAAQFAAAWARPDQPTDQWWSTIDPLCTRQLSSLLRANGGHTRFPAHRVTGTPQLSRQDPGTLAYTVATDAGTLTITMISRDRQWKVSSLLFPDQQEPAQKPASGP